MHKQQIGSAIFYADLLDTSIDIVVYVWYFISDSLKPKFIRVSNCYTIYENNEKYWNEIIKQFLKDDNCGNIRSTK